MHVCVYVSVCEGEDHAYSLASGCSSRVRVCSIMSWASVQGVSILGVTRCISLQVGMEERGGE